MPLNITKLNTCCFTGHRPSKLPWGSNEKDGRCAALKARLFDVVEALYGAGMRHFICGMAQGCDLFFCEAVIRLRDEHEDVTLEAAIPCEGQDRSWREAQRGAYAYFVSQCDFETVLQKEYTDDCMRRRNQYMVDSSSVLVAVFDGSSGGTAQTIGFAEKAGLQIIELRP